MPSNTKNWVHAAMITLAVGGAMHLFQQEQNTDTAPSLTVPRDAQPTPAGAFAAQRVLAETNAGWKELNRELTKLDHRIDAYAAELAGLRQKRLSSAATAMPGG